MEHDSCVSSQAQPLTSPRAARRRPKRPPRWLAADLYRWNEFARREPLWAATGGGSSRRRPGGQLPRGRGSLGRHLSRDVLPLASRPAASVRGLPSSPRHGRRRVRGDGDWEPLQVVEDEHEGGRFHPFAPMAGEVGKVMSAASRGPGGYADGSPTTPTHRSEDVLDPRTRRQRAGAGTTEGQRRIMRATRARIRVQIGGLLVQA